ncbi:hypothetical protein [Sphingobium boeckii]|uniref:Uncharacterized protein n=1 Tax=Sphingobium boeckii TaxID=1082345 RepID=A0A7W9ED43_9SPHN|nr:hypothetical protein [Sphingobium boeckii]MBB5684903.1 hypothetical protein [Sphingobium boeckii]
MSDVPIWGILERQKSNSFTTLVSNRIQHGHRVIATHPVAYLRRSSAIGASASMIDPSLPLSANFLGPAAEGQLCQQP